MPGHSRSSGTARYPWPRWIVHVHLANGGVVKQVGHLVSREHVALFGRGGARQVVELGDDDGWYVEGKRRLTILRARLRADDAAARSGTYPTGEVTCRLVHANDRA